MTYTTFAQARENSEKADAALFAAKCAYFDAATKLASPRHWSTVLQDPKVLELEKAIYAAEIEAKKFSCARAS